MADAGELKGVVIIHDYNHAWPGIQKAVDEFSKTIEEIIMEIADWQGIVMIVTDRGYFYSIG